MNTSAGGRNKKHITSGSPGVFRPGMPADTYEVIRLFAIAARAGIASPEQLDHITARLQAITQHLVVPEKAAAQECMRLWQLFARVAQLPKATLRIEASQAFYRDIDVLGQKLDMPPLADWEELPEAIDDPTAEDWVEQELAPLVMDLASVRLQAREVMADQPLKAPFPAEQTAKLLAVLDHNDRRQTFERLIGNGLLGRSDVNLLIRFLVKGDDVRPSDTMLVEVLERLGRWLAQ